MNIRPDQLTAMQSNKGFRRLLAQGLDACGVSHSIDSRNEDLIIAAEGAGSARLGFDRHGRIDSYRGIDGRKFRIEYDRANRPVKLVDPAKKSIDIGYDAQNRVTAVIDQAGFKREFAYPGANAVEIHRAGLPPLRANYAPSGRPLSIADGRGNASTFVPGEAGRLDRFTDRAGHTTRYKYDSDGKLASFTTPRGDIWRVRESAGGRMRSIFSPDGAAETQHFQDDWLVGMTRRDGSYVAVEYAGASKPTTIRYPGGLTVELAYDEAGRITRADNGAHIVEFTYDAEGRRTSETVDGRRVEISYDADGFPSALRNEQGAEARFSHGPDQRIARVIDWSGNATIVQRDARGDIIGLRFPCDALLRRSRTPAGLIERDEVVAAGGTISREYRYDANDLVERIADSAHGEKRHEFDLEDQLIAVRSKRAELEFRYDSHGNATQVGALGLKFDSCDRISVASGVSAKYDAIGNLTEWADARGAMRLTWNAMNQLARVELPDGRFAEYEYDAFGRRIVKRLGGVVTRYTWCGEQLIGEEVEGRPSSRVDYLYLPHTNMPLAMRSGGRVYYFQCDHLDTPVRLLDANGRVAWSAEAHGYAFLEIERSVRQPLRFPGQYHDEETGLYYNLSRYFQPATGRYLSPDPLLFDGGSNLYVYAGNRPHSETDATGRLGPLAIIGIAVVGGAVIGAAFGAARQAANNWAQGRPLGEGVLGAAGRGALTGAAAGLGAAVGGLLGGPMGALAGGLLGGMAANVGMAVLEAPEGQGWEACKQAVLDSIPFVGTLDRYFSNPDAPNAGRQLAVDLVFDVIDSAMMLIGLRSARGGRSSRGRRVVREDSRPYSPDGRAAGRRKSHIDADGNLRPANPDGKATVQDHVRGSEPRKSDSPYTSFKMDEGTGKAYGDQRIRVDVERLQRDIDSGKVKDVEIVSNERVLAELDRHIADANARYEANPTQKNLDRLNRARDDRANAARDSEVLIRGVVPAEYITVESTGSGTAGGTAVGAGASSDNQPP